MGRGGAGPFFFFHTPSDALFGGNWVRTISEGRVALSRDLISFVFESLVNLASSDLTSASFVSFDLVESTVFESMDVSKSC